MSSGWLHHQLETNSKDYFILTSNHNQLIRNEWTKVDGRPVLPAMYEKKVGRQKKIDVSNLEIEGPNSEEKIYRNCRIMHSSHCGGSNHNGVAAVTGRMEFIPFMVTDRGHRLRNQCGRGVALMSPPLLKQSLYMFRSSDRRHHRLPVASLSIASFFTPLDRTVWN
jgi:hypothetical protein